MLATFVSTGRSLTLCSTAWPSGLSVAASWDVEAISAWGTAMGYEFAQKVGWGGAELAGEVSGAEMPELWQGQSRVSRKQGPLIPR